MPASRRKPITGRVLIVEDDTGLRESVAHALTRAGHTVYEADSLATAGARLDEAVVDVVLLDNQLADGYGTALLERVHNLGDSIGVIMVTAYPDIRVAIGAMREGVRDFIIKPFELTDLKRSVSRLLEEQKLRRDVRRLERERHRPDVSNGLPGACEAIASLNANIARVAAVDTPVLVIGETGTGKELVANAIHDQSLRAGNAIVTVNCSAFSDQLLESELFGHEKGAFTGATESHEGVFEMADGGTLFLDEIGEMKPELQSKLLRVVEGQSFRRLGGKREIQTDVRVVAATNRELQRAIRNGEFREDLYFRLSAFPIRVPPLRERGNDVMMLARVFLRRACTASARLLPEINDGAGKMLMEHHWPGNVRELRNVIERAAILCEGSTIGPEHLPNGMNTSGISSPDHWVDNEEGLPPLADVEMDYIRHVLGVVNGNRSRAAQILGIARNTLRARLNRAEGDDPDADRSNGNGCNDSGNGHGKAGTVGGVRHPVS